MPKRLEMKIWSYYIDQIADDKRDGLPTISNATAASRLSDMLRGWSWPTFNKIFWLKQPKRVFKLRMQMKFQYNSP